MHLFRSASDRMLCSLESGSSRPVDPDKRQPMDTAAVSHISAYVDEVSWVVVGVRVLVQVQVQVPACEEGRGSVQQQQHSCASTAAAASGQLLCCGG